MGAIMILILQMGQIKLILPPAQGSELGHRRHWPGSLTLVPALVTTETEWPIRAGGHV